MFRNIFECLSLNKVIRKLKTQKEVLEIDVQTLENKKWKAIQNISNAQNETTNLEIKRLELSKQIETLKKERSIFSNNNDSKESQKVKTGFLSLMRDSRALLDSLSEKFYDFEKHIPARLGLNEDMTLLPTSDVYRFIEEAAEQINSLSQGNISNEFAKAAISAIQEAAKKVTSGFLIEAYFYAIVASTWAEAAFNLESIISGKGTEQTQNQNKFIDYYEILGVDPTAGFEQIKQAYRQRVKETHPDLNGNSEKTKEEFLKIQLAYSVLSNPLERRKYNKKYDAEKAGQRFATA